MANTTPHQDIALQEVQTGTNCETELELFLLFVCFFAILHSFFKTNYTLCDLF